MIFCKLKNFFFLFFFLILRVYICKSNSDNFENFVFYQNGYIKYPINIELGYQAGFSSSIKQLLRSDEKNDQGSFDYNKTFKKNLFSQSIIIGFYWTQISKFPAENLSTYPKVGFILKWNKLENGGNIFSFLLNFSPKRDFLSCFSFYPSLIIGPTFCKIPSVYPKNIIILDNIDSSGKNIYKTIEEPESEWHKIYYRNDFSVELTFLLNFDFCFFENYIVSLFLGVTYIPEFNKLSKQEAVKLLNNEPLDNSREYLQKKSFLFFENTDLLFFNFGLKLAYESRENEIDLQIEDPKSFFKKICFEIGFQKYPFDLEYDLKTDFNKNLNLVNNNLKTKYWNSLFSDINLNAKFYKNLYSYSYITFGINLNYEHNLNGLYAECPHVNKIFPLIFSFQIGHSFVFNKLNIDTTLGINLFSPKWFILRNISGVFKNLFYVELSLDYKIFKNLVLGGSIKSDFKILYKEESEIEKESKFKFSKFYGSKFCFLNPQIRIGFVF